MAAPTDVLVRRQNWSDDETWLLIHIWEQNIVELKSLKRNLRVYQRITDKLAEHGVHRSVKQVHMKIVNLTQAYRKAAREYRLGSDIAQKWPLFNELHRILSSPGPDSPYHHYDDSVSPSCSGEAGEYDYAATEPYVVISESVGSEVTGSTGEDAVVSSNSGTPMAGYHGMVNGNDPSGTPSVSSVMSDEKTCKKPSIFWIKTLVRLQRQNMARADRRFEEAMVLRKQQLQIQKKSLQLQVTMVHTLEKIAHCLEQRSGLQEQSDGSIDDCGMLFKMDPNSGEMKYDP